MSPVDVPLVVLTIRKTNCTIVVAVYLGSDVSLLRTAWHAKAVTRHRRRQNEQRCYCGGALYEDIIKHELLEHHDSSHVTSNVISLLSVCRRCTYTYIHIYIYIYLYINDRPLCGHRSLSFYAHIPETYDYSCCSLPVHRSIVHDYQLSTTVYGNAALERDLRFYLWLTSVHAEKFWISMLPYLDLPYFTFRCEHFEILKII